MNYEQMSHDKSRRLNFRVNNIMLLINCIHIGLGIRLRTVILG